VDPGDEALTRELPDVPADRHVGDAELVDEVGHAHPTVLLHRGEDLGPPLAGEQRLVLARPLRRAAAVSGGHRFLRVVAD
jgi:hypothetical protein